MADTSPSYGLVTTLHELAALAARIIADGKPIGFDIETGYDGPERENASKHPEENFVVGFSFTNSLSWARYVPLRHDTGTNLPVADALRWLWKMLATGLGVPHNGVFELRCLSRAFMEYLAGDPEVGEAVRAGWLPGPGYFPVRSDTMLEAHAEGTHKSVGLKPLTRETFGHEMADLHSLFQLPGGKALTKRQKDSIRFNSLDQHSPDVTNYGGEDALWALRHHLLRYPDLTSPSNPRRFIYQLEMAVLPIVCMMEDEGLCYDWNTMREDALRAREFAGRLQAEINADLTAAVRERTPDAASIAINLGSPKQLGNVMYTLLGMEVRHRTDAGAPSTGKLAMKYHARKHPVIQKIQNWKSLTKLAGTYLEKYVREYTYADDGRAHPGLLQTGVPAGRFAAVNPAVQQSPKKYLYRLADGTAFIHNFRDNIVAPAGWYGLGFDMAQQELRIIAGEAGEAVMVQAFRDGVDVHSKTAGLMLGKPLESVTPDERDIGKTLGLALGYSLSPSGLAERLNITKDASQELFDSYFGTYPAIARWMDLTKTEARALGYTTTRWSGRRVPIWELQSDNPKVFSKGLREAGNTPIQGAAADYIKAAMVRADQALRKAGLQDLVRPCLNMHDALEWYVRQDVDAAAVIAVLEPAVVFTTPALECWPPMQAEWHLWRKWGSARNIEVLPGGLRFKGTSAPAAEREVDGDVDEDGPDLPAVDISKIHVETARDREPPPPALVAGSSDSNGVDGGHDRDGLVPGVSRTLVIRLPGMPSADGFRALVGLIRSVPGPHHAIVSVDGGDDVPVAASTGLLPERDGARVALLVPGARLVWHASSVDTASLASGVRL